MTLDRLSFRPSDGPISPIHGNRSANDAAENTICLNFMTRAKTLSKRYPTFIVSTQIVICRRIIFSTIPIRQAAFVYCSDGSIACSAGKLTHRYFQQCRWHHQYHFWVFAKKKHLSVTVPSYNSYPPSIHFVSFFFFNSTVPCVGTIVKKRGFMMS